MLQIMGKSQATVSQMRSYLKKVNPSAARSVIDMLLFYLSEGEAEGIRGDIAFAQSCLETGNFMFAGSAVTLDCNNFCGLGVTRNGEKGIRYETPQLGIRAQIQHLQAYASDEKLKGVCIDPRYVYVKRGSAPYVEWLGIQENPSGAGWAAGKDYGAKIIRILEAILSEIQNDTEEEGSSGMTINKNYISNNNSYDSNNPIYIVIHCTDNFAAGADAFAHARAQYNGNLQGTSVHFYVDDGNTAYQVLPYGRGPWHVGVNYGGRLFGTVHNRNSIGIEMCVQAGYNYERAFQNTVALCKQVMKELGINADHVVTHYDVCAKNCPSAIRAHNDWDRFKSLIGSAASVQVSIVTEEKVVDKLYRVRTSWENSQSQIGAYRDIDNAMAACAGREGYHVYDWTGLEVLPVYDAGEKTSDTSSKCPFLVRVNITNLNVRTGPGKEYSRVQFIPIGVYTIVEVKSGKGSESGWGKLKSGMGWIALDFTERV